jgi:hypothetical protein
VADHHQDVLNNFLMIAVVAAEAVAAATKEAAAP